MMTMSKRMMMTIMMMMTMMTMMTMTIKLSDDGSTHSIRDGNEVILANDDHIDDDNGDENC